MHHHFLLVVAPPSVVLCSSVAADVFVVVVSSAVSSSTCSDKFSHEPPVGTHEFSHGSTGGRCGTQYKATIPTDTKGTNKIPYKPRSHTTTTVHADRRLTHVEAQQPVAKSLQSACCCCSVLFSVV